MTMYSFLAVSILMLIETSNAYSTELNMDLECPTYQVYHPNEGHSYKLIWNGEAIRSDCKFKFSGRGDDILDEYKVCVEMVEYDINDCDVKLQFYFGYSSFPRNTYSCNDYIPSTCAVVGERFGVKLSTFPYHSKPYYSNSHLKLKVTAIKSYNYTESVGTIVGSVIGGIALLVIVVIITIIIICNRRKRNTGGFIYNHRNQTLTTSTTVTTNNPYPPAYPYTVQQHMSHQQDPTQNYFQPHTNQQHLSSEGPKMSNTQIK